MKTVIYDEHVYRDYKPMLCQCCCAPMTDKTQCDYCGVRYDTDEPKEDNDTAPDINDDNMYYKMFCNMPSLSHAQFQYSTQSRWKNRPIWLIF